MNYLLDIIWELWYIILYEEDLSQTNKETV